MHQPIQVLLELNISMQIAQNVFVNAFAANEPQSTKAILNKVESYNYPYDKKIIILNCRSDRVDRTQLC